MELYLVKEEVKVTDAATAFSRTKDFNDYVSRLVRVNKRGGNDSKDENKSQEEDDCDRVLLKMTNFPVALKSICGEESEYSEKFAKRMERKFLPEGVHEFGNLDMSLVICERPNSLDGYFLISGLTDGSKTDILKQFREEYNNCDPFLEFKIEVSLGYLPTGSTAIFPPSPSSVMTLKAEEMNFRLHHNHVRNRRPVRVPAEVREWWKQATGFIYTKLSVKVELSFDAVDRVYNCSDNIQLRQDLLNGLMFGGDVEIGCKDGKVVKCHRKILADKNGLLNHKFKEMLENGKDGDRWKLKMEMSQDAVWFLLAYNYCGFVSGALESCDLALELHRVGPEYGFLELAEKMEEIIMAMGSLNFAYFSVKGALDLFLYARDVNGLEHLRDKAVRVLRNYLKSASDQILESKEYEDLFQNDPKCAMELSGLYFKLE